MRADRTLRAILLVFAAAAALPACTRPADLARPGILADWEKNVLQRDSGAAAARRLAEEAGSRPACLKDRLAHQWVKEQALEEERKFAGAPVVGTWNGLDLSGFHRAGGTFLKDHGHVIYDGSEVNFVGCTGIPCIYNRVYGKPDDHEIGWKAYFWYLRTGTALSAINRVHDQAAAEAGQYDGTSYALDKYLFKEAELDGFWKIAHTGGERFRASRYFKRLHRVPHGSDIEDEKDTVCGIAYSSGEILVNDGCLVTGTSSLFRGFFYVGVPHEIGHEIDFALGPAAHDRYSETEEFMELSGWFTEEFTDEEGERRSRWAIPPEDEREGLDGFIRDYAGTTPAEDFADSLAYVRYRGDETKTAIPRKNALLSQKVFGGRTFDPDGLIAAYRDIGRRGIEAALARMVRDCVSPSAADPGSAESAAPAIELGVALPPSIQGCINRGFASLVESATAELKATELEACDTLTDERLAALRTSWIDDLKGRVATLVTDERRVARIVQATEDFRAELAAMVDPREAYLNCFRSRGGDGAPNAEECYSRVLSEAFDRVAAGYEEAIQEMFPVERERYLAENTFESSQTRTRELYVAMFGGVDTILGAKSNARWRECLAAPAGTLDAAAVVMTAPFSGGTQYIAAHVLNCINSAVEPDLDEVRDRFTGDKFQVGSQEARAFLRIAVLLPRYLDLLQGRANRLAAEEQRDNEEALARSTSELQTALLAQKSWIEGAADEADAGARCDAEALRRVQGTLGSGSDGVRTIFTPIAQIERSVAANACREVLRSPQLRADLEAMARRRWEAALANLETVVAQQADRQAEVCWTEYPRKTSTHRMGRRRCFERHWDRVISRGFEAWSTSEGGRRFTSRHNEARTHLNGRKQALLAQARDRMEALH